MENEPSALATLRQLKEWLDAGAITPTEFEVLKRKLLFSDTSESTAAPATPPSAPPTPPPAPPDPVATPATVVTSSAPLPPPPPSWDFKHDPTVTVRPVEDPVTPPANAAPSRVEPTPRSAAPIPPVFTPPAVPPVQPVVPPREQSQVSPKRPAPPIDTFTRPVEMVKVGSSSYRDADSLTPTEPQTADSRRPRPAIPPPSGRSPLATVLIVGGILALLALIAYLVMDDRESEHLTSLSRSGADTVSVAPEVGPQVEQLELPPATNTDSESDTARVTPALPATLPAATTDTARSAPAPAAQAPVTTAPTPSASETPAPATTSSPSTAPEDSQATPAEQTPATPPASGAKVGEVEAKVRSALSSYYEDLKAPPFNAAQHFAPTVERFYTLQNTTPAAISAELDRSHFPEFLEGETQGVPGSLTISEPVRDGSRVVTYLEKSRAFRKSRQQYQNTTAQVRIRFNRDFKIVYLRQERLLENTFSE